MYTFKTQVTASHTGKDGFQTPVSVLSMMQDCSQLWLDSEPAFRQYLDEHNLTMMISSRQVDFVKRAFYGTALTAATSVYDCNGYLGYRNTALYGEDGTPYATSWSVGVFVSKETGKPARLSKQVLETLTYDEKLDMPYLNKRIDLPATAPQQLSNIVVQRSDIDINQHVNNTQYIRMAYEYAPEDVTFARLRVEYKGQAKQGDLITPQLYSGDEGSFVVALLSAEETPYAYVEFSEPSAI